jgi:hypothetical protein
VRWPIGTSPTSRPNFGGLGNATAAPFEVRAGRAVVSEEQTVVITTAASEANFVLHFGGIDTAAISTTASAAQVQAALDAVFADIDVVSFSGKRLTVRFGGASAGTDVALMTATATTTAGSADLTVVQQGSTENIAGQAAHAVVVDYGTGATALTVATGPSSSFTFDMDGARGDIVEASGNLVIDAFGFFQLDGYFAFTSSYGAVTLADGTVVDAQLLTLGASSVDAFAGIGGGTADAVGLSLSDVDFGLALVGDRNNAARSWMSLQATAGSVDFVGIDGLEISATDLSVTINKAATVDHSVIDYAQQNLDVAAGGGNTVTLDMDGKRGDLLEASGHADDRRLRLLPRRRRLRHHQVDRTASP